MIISKKYAYHFSAPLFLSLLFNSLSIIIFLLYWLPFRTQYTFDNKLFTLIMTQAPEGIQHLWTNYSVSVHCECISFASDGNKKASTATESTPLSQLKNISQKNNKNSPLPQDFASNGNLVFCHKIVTEMKAENVSMLNGKNKTRRKWFKEKLDSWFGLHGVLQRLKGDGQSTIHISRRTTCKLISLQGIPLN